MSTARSITAAMRELYPRPVRLSVRAGPGDAGRFLLRVPSAAARGDDEWLEGFLSRHLGAQVAIASRRDIRRHDCGRDVEYTLQVKGGSE